MSLCTETHGAPVAQPYTIIEHVRGLNAKVADVLGDWSSMLRKVVVGALALHSLRPSQISVHERVTLMWIVCGDETLRAHDGEVWYYDVALGCWVTFSGVLPQDVHEKARRYCLLLEGVFREFSGKVDRDEDGVLNAVVTALQRHSTSEMALRRFRSNALFSKGNGAGQGSGIATHRKRRDSDADASAPGQYEDDGDVDIAEEAAADMVGEVSGQWFIRTAQAVTKMGSMLQYDLGQSKVLGLFAG